MRIAAAREDVFQAVADPTRRRMLELLRESDLSVNELRRSFAMSQPAVSQHLRVLRQAGLVRRQRAGRRQLYRIHPRPLAAVYTWVKRQFKDPFGHVWVLAGPKKRGETSRRAGRPRN